MISKFATFALAVLTLLPVATHASVDSYFDTEESSRRELAFFRGSSSQLCRKFKKVLALKVINLTRAQPFAPNFFVMIHNDRAKPLFEFNMKASGELANLAQNGVADDLVKFYQQPENMQGVGVVGTTTAPAAPGGDPLYINLDALSATYPYVTIASMFVNSNDGFAAINGKIVRKGDVMYLNGLDAGAEANTENCGDIPGPACRDINTNNESPAEPEGTQFVRVHSGFFGVGTEDGEDTLTAERYDWRNPMLRVEVVCADEELLSGPTPDPI